MRRRLCAAAGGFWLLASAAIAQPQLDVQVRPQSITDAQVAQLVISGPTPADAKELVLSLEPPPGFKVEPQTVRHTGGSPLREVVNLQRTDATLQTGSRIVVVRIRSAGTVLASQTVDFTFYNSTIRPWRYLLLGLTGVALGWVIKILLKGLASVPDPIPPVAQRHEAGAKEHWLVTFVRNNYLTVDFVVTLLVGFFVLLAALQGSLAPTGTQWPGALAMGFGIGILANNDLLARLRP